MKEYRKMIKLFVVMATVLFSSSLLAGTHSFDDPCARHIESGPASGSITEAPGRVVKPKDVSSSILRINFPEEGQLEINQEDVFLGESEFTRLLKLVVSEFGHERTPRGIIYRDQYGNRIVGLLTTIQETVEVDSETTKTFTCVLDQLMYLD